MVDGCGSLEISLAKPIVLEDLDGSRIRVGVEIIRVVADHRAKISHRMGRKSVLVGGDSHGLNVVRSLALARGLLHLFVRNIVARDFVANDESQAIFRRQVALVVDRKIAQRAGIRIVLRNHGIQIVVGHAAAGAGAECILAPGVLAFRESAGRIKATAGKHYLAVETWLRILQRVHFDHAAHFSAIFGGNARGVDAHRLHIVGVHRRSEAGRAIVRQRNAVDHKLGLILRAAGMQDGIAFVQPAGLRIHQVLQGTAREPSRAGFG